MPAAAITGAVGLYSANQAGNANDDAIEASQDATDQSIALQQGMFDQVRGDLAPYMGAGTNALALLGKVNAGDYSGFENSPDYLYARDQAEYGVTHSAANAGSLYSGGTSLDLGRELTGLASQNFQGYRNNLLSLAGMGANAAAGVGTQGMGMASNVSNLLTGNAANAAAGYQNQANINGQLAAGLGGAFGDWYNARPQQPTTAATPAEQWPEMDYDYSNWDWG